VTDADVTFERLLMQLASEVGQFAHVAPDGDAAIVSDDGDAGAIIAAIL
jgi:hypothetical protein